MAVVDQIQRTISTYSGSVVRLLIVSDDRVKDERLVPLLQILTGNNLIRINASRLKSLIRFIKTHIKTGKDSSAITRTVNREFSAQIFALNDRTEVHKQALVVFEAILKVFLAVQNKEQKRIGFIPTIKDEKGPYNFKTYFNKDINDSRKPLTYVRLIDNLSSKSGLPVLDVGGSGQVIRIPISHNGQTTSKDNLIKVFELIKLHIERKIKNSFLVKLGSEEDEDIFIARVTEDGRLVLNIENDFDIEHSKMVTDSLDKTIFVVDTILENLK